VPHQIWNNECAIAGRCYVEEFMNYNGHEYNLFGVYNDIYQKTTSAYSFEKKQFNILQLQKVLKIHSIFRILINKSGLLELF
jgi:hypothetical protein